MVVPIETMENARNFWRPLIDTRFSPANTGDLETVDSELLVLEEMRLRALRLRNERTPVCKLPSEILANIFLCLRDGWPPSRQYHSVSPSEQRPSYTSGWMCATHICRKLRTVAKGTPGLWAKYEDILDTPLHYLPTILARSRTCPLDLMATGLGKGDLENLMSWLSQPVCLRVRHLYLDVYDQEVMERLLPQISKYLRNIRSLNLDLVEYETLVELPLQICAMSDITDLGLQGFRFPWDAAMFSSSLTRLVLQLCEGDQSMQPSYAQFRGLCANMHSLRELSLHEITPHNPSNELIHMPRTLQEFNYSANDGPSAFAALQLLAHIRFPDTCTRIASVYHNQDDNLAEGLIGSCNNVCSLSEGNEESGPLEMLYTYGSLLTLRAELPFRSMYTDVYSLHPSRLYPQQWNSFGPFAYLDVTHLNFDEHITSMRLTDLRAITFFPDNRRINLMPILERLVLCAPRVHRVEVWFARCLPLLYALAIHIDGSFPLFPALDTLVLHGANAGYINEPNLCAELTALTACIGVRKSEGAPLREIVVAKCTNSWGVWDALKGDIAVTFL
ncbi:hypothetical protein PENSPDRAFT_736203 [Peniophora sp. CONT]|nr:hypothetical protein PENSPDRAFT_736203 [Peniophora sp. CONT]